MPAYKTIVVNLAFGHYVIRGPVGAGLERVASPFGVVPFITLPSDGPVAWVKGECCPAAVLARGVVGYAVGDVLLAVYGCRVRYEQFFVCNCRNFDAFGVFVGAAVCVDVAWLDYSSFVSALEWSAGIQILV